MLTLVIETATAACSIALFDGERIVARDHVVVGRGHAEYLVPMIAELPNHGRADRILVDCGPGSFTGVRVGLAAAIGLGIGWNVPVLGYSSLASIAVADGAAGGVAVVLAGGHGELFIQRFMPNPLVAIGPLASMKPAAIIDAVVGGRVVGTGIAALLEIDPKVMATERLPDAADAMLLPDVFRTLPPRPIYGRAPDAKVAA